MIQSLHFFYSTIFPLWFNNKTGSTNTIPNWKQIPTWTIDWSSSLFNIRVPVQSIQLHRINWICNGLKDEKKTYKKIIIKKREEGEDTADREGKEIFILAESQLTKHYWHEACASQAVGSNSAAETLLGGKVTWICWAVVRWEGGGGGEQGEGVGDAIPFRMPLTRYPNIGDQNLTNSKPIKNLLRSYCNGPKAGGKANKIKRI